MLGTASLFDLIYCNHVMGIESRNQIGKLTGVVLSYDIIISLLTCKRSGKLPSTVNSEQGLLLPARAS